MPSSCAMPTFVTSNRSFIRIEKSDGNPSMLPDVESSSVPQLEDASEKVNYLEEADDHTMKRWLTKIGTYLAHRDGEGWDRTRLQRFQLVSLPEHYKLYAHRTAGQRSRPRKDYYLYGSGTPGCEYFRSPEEFTLHAEWLTLGCPINTDGTSSCGCCYCSGRKQGDISKKLKKHVAHTCIRETAIRNRTGATRPQNVVWSGNRRSERLQHGIRISSQQIYAANTWSKKRNTATSVSERVTSWLEGLGDPVPQGNRA